MSDVWHDWGADLNLDSTGDLLVATDENLGRQRILRRLLTNPGSYIWALDYGGGLGSFIGEPVAAEQIESVISTQMALETYVDATQAPTAAITNSASMDGGTISVQVQYKPASQQATQVLKFSVPGFSS